MRKIPWKWTVPNALSLFRLLLVPVIAITYWASEYDETYLYVAVGALVLSGLSDAMDGWIARRFNQITEIGKLLDPIADKLTQVTVVVCLTLRYPRLLPLLAICVVKEACQAIGGFLLLVIDGRQPSSMGATYLDIIGIIQSYGAVNAANLDGGNSSSMVYKGKIITTPAGVYGERTIPTFVLVEDRP